MACTAQSDCGGSADTSETSCILISRPRTSQQPTPRWLQTRRGAPEGLSRSDHHGEQVAAGRADRHPVQTVAEAIERAVRVQLGLG